MKFNKFLFAILAGGMLASCSDELAEIATENESPKKETPMSTGYIAISIGMPPANSTRAENDHFDHGDAKEYAVKSAAILFFTGREQDAQFYKAYDIGNSYDKDKIDAQISANKVVTFPVDFRETTETLWALAVINYEPLGWVIQNEAKQEGESYTLKINGVNFTGTIGDFMDVTANSIQAVCTERNGFLMSNTPYSTAPGGVNAPTGLVHLLATVDKEKIKDTEDAAKQDPAAQIYVERAVAKVNVKLDDQISIYSELTQGSGLNEVESIEWLIDNTEPTSYIVRNLRKINAGETKDPSVAPAWLNYSSSLVTVPKYKYRFVGDSPIDADMYRIYFGIDPHGDGVDDRNTLIHLADDATEGFKSIGSSTDKSQYCFENTFSVDKMDWMNTTRATLKVKFKGGSFYTRGKDHKTRYALKDAVSAMAHYVLFNSEVTKAWNEYFSDQTFHGTATINDLAATPSNNMIWENKWMKLEFEIESGRLKLKDFTLYDGADPKNTVPLIIPEGSTEENIKTKVKNDVHAQADFKAFENGYSYYSIRVKHFGDELTPWNEPEENILTEYTSQSYGTGDAATRNALGRYTVLRNNWYEISIQSIGQYGEPTVGDLKLDHTPDDVKTPQQAISCKINILSWAKRSQTEKL